MLMCICVGLHGVYFGVVGSCVGHLKWIMVVVGSAVEIKFNYKYIFTFVIRNGVDIQVVNKIFDLSDQGPSKFAVRHIV